jgi:hypothetical protein
MADKRMSISHFFKDRLGAPLSNTRWSWGAVNAQTGQVFLRVWVDERQTVGSTDQIHLLGSDWNRRSPGYPERERQVALLRSSAGGYGVLCVAQNPHTRGARKIKEFDDQMLLKFGSLIERDGAVYATIVGSVPVERLRRGIPRQRMATIAEQVTQDDVLGALYRLVDGASHPFGTSTGYDVLYEGRRYPPKAVFGLAAERAAGESLGPYDFQAGPGKECFRTLERLGFPPVPKVAGSSGREEEEDAAEVEIRQRTDIGATEKLTLISARRGQGVFRDNLEQIERKCWMTGVSDRNHLRASHIKPWCKCATAEKLDGFNGLLLSPHFDHLFDRGYLSFENDGTVLVSPGLNTKVLDAWRIRLPKRTKAFRPESHKYLSYHRRHIFRRGAE